MAHSLLYYKQATLYASRYYASKAATRDQVIVKVDGGYKIMSASDYNIWRKQK